MDIKNKYERRLREEKEANLRLKGETGIMRKKVTSVWLFNPLTLKSDQHLISPYNITPKSPIKVMRVKEMIIN